jgi:uncharacterized DUF497 family protein
MKYEYDPKKSASNKEKHGLTLGDAAKLWDNPHVEIKAKTVGEARFMVIGRLNKKCYSCIYTRRGNVVRLISARRSRKSEEEVYYEYI